MSRDESSGLYAVMSLKNSKYLSCQASGMVAFTNNTIDSNELFAVETLAKTTDAGSNSDLPKGNYYFFISQRTKTVLQCTKEGGLRCQNQNRKLWEGFKLFAQETDGAVTGGTEVTNTGLLELIKVATASLSQDQDLLAQVNRLIGINYTSIDFDEWCTACMNPDVRAAFDKLVVRYPGITRHEHIFEKLHAKDDADQYAALTPKEILDGFKGGLLAERAYETTNTPMPAANASPSKAPPGTRRSDTNAADSLSDSKMVNLLGLSNEHSATSGNPDERQAWLHTSAHRKAECSTIGRALMHDKGYANGTFTLIPEASRETNSRIRDQYVLCVMYNNKSTFHLLKAPSDQRSELYVKSAKNKQATSKLKKPENNVIPEHIQGLTAVGAPTALPCRCPLSAALPPLRPSRPLPCLLAMPSLTVLCPSLRCRVFFLHRPLSIFATRRRRVRLAPSGRYP